MPRFFCSTLPFCILAIFTVQLSLGQQHYPSQMPEIIDLQAPALAVQPANAIIWEITGKNIIRPSYIFGIIQKTPNDHFFLPENLTPAIRSTDRLVMEIDPRNADFDYLHRGALPIDSTIEEQLSRKEFEKFKGFIVDSLSPISHYKLEKRYAPMVLAKQMVSDYCLGHKKGKEPIDYELYLAHAIKKPFKSLELHWAREGWVDSYSAKEQINYLKGVLKNRKTLCHNYLEMVKAYRRQDLDAVWLWAKDAPDMGANASQFIQARNQIWLKELTWQLTYESLFIVINAVQLPGEYGLLHKLRKEGYTVKPYR